MDKALPFLFIAPIAMFFIGIYIARQIRPLENSPFVRILFVQKKWLLSIGTGFLLSGIFTPIYFATFEFLFQKVIGFLVLFLLVSGSYHLGMRLGWGEDLSINETILSHRQSQSTQSLENVIVDNTPSSIRITIHSKKRWGRFVLKMFQLTFVGLIAVPIVSLLIVALLQNYLPESMKFLIWVLVAGLLIYLLRTSFERALEHIFDKEIIEIDNLSIKIEKYGAKFKSRKVYPAENIKKVTAMFSLGGKYRATNRSRFPNSIMPVFMIQHSRGLKRYRSFGKAIDLADAQDILDIIYGKYPQYKGS